MVRRVSFGVVLVLLVVAAGRSQPGGDKKNDNDRKTAPREAEVSFANGSLVRMTLAAEKIEISTVYGKLSVPVQDIRRIEFGLHFPEGAETKIETAIKQLGAVEFKERVAAVQELVAL